MIRSLVTLASTEAAAMHAMVASPFGTASAGTVSPRTGKPSVSAYAGPGSSRANARRIPSMFITCSPCRSTSAAGMITTDQAIARRTTSA